MIYSPSFQKLLNADSLLLAQAVLLEKGLNEVHVKIHQLHLKPGRYPIGLWLANPTEIFELIESAFEIEVINEDNRQTPEIPNDGVMACDFNIYQPILT